MFREGIDSDKLDIIIALYRQEGLLANILPLCNAFQNAIDHALKPNMHDKGIQAFNTMICVYSEFNLLTEELERSNLFRYVLEPINRDYNCTIWPDAVQKAREQDQKRQMQVVKHVITIYEDHNLLKTKLTKQDKGYIKTESDHGVSIFSRAIQSNNELVFSEIVSAYKREGLLRQALKWLDFGCITPLMTAIYEGNLNIVKTLIELYKEEGLLLQVLSYQSPKGTNTLMFALIKHHDSADLINLIIQAYDENKAELENDLFVRNCCDGKNCVDFIADFPYKIDGWVGEINSQLPPTLEALN